MISLTPSEATARRAAAAERRRQHPADGPWSRGLSERCITFGVPRFQAAYSSVFQIVQSRDQVVFLMETIHDARVIPLDGRAHLGPNLTQWDGNSRGHWEGETLVVETTGFSAKSDPTTWTQPWTVRINFKQTQEPLIEYACHEGNLGMVGILSGARKAERDAQGRK